MKLLFKLDKDQILKIKRELKDVVVIIGDSSYSTVRFINSKNQHLEFSNIKTRDFIFKLPDLGDDFLKEVRYKKKNNTFKFDTDYIDDYLYCHGNNNLFVLIEQCSEFNEQTVDIERVLKERLYDKEYKQLKDNIKMKTVNKSKKKVNGIFDL